MAISEVSICNQALMNLGANPIISLDDDTTEAKICKVFYEPIRNVLLETNNWTFTIQWLTLAQAASPPLSEFANAFPLPVNASRVLFVGENYERPNRKWQVEGNNIVTDETTCKAQVVILETDPNKYSAAFIQALVARLSADMAIAITNSRSLYETHMQIFGMKLQEAISTDNLQGKTRRIRSRWLQDARWSGAPTAGPFV